MAAAWGSACLPVPITAASTGPVGANALVATADMAAVRSWPRAKASTTARKAPDAASHKTSRGVAPPAVWAQVLVPTRPEPSNVAPMACNVWPSPQTRWVLAMVAA